MRTAKNRLVAISLTLFTFSVVVLFVNCNDTVLVENNTDTNPVYTVPHIPDSLTFCGELVPLHYTDVYEALEKELIKNNFWHSQTIQIIKRTGRYFPTIEKILEEEGMPQDLKYLAIAESALEHVVSPAGAKGFWQLMEGTGKDYGLEIYSEVDERYHLEKSTYAAISFLKDSYKKYNNWTLAGASYNVGRRGVDRQVTKQGEDNYYNILFNSETGRYIYRVLSYKLWIENPEVYGFHIPEEEYYKPYQTKNITVDKTIVNFSNFAKEHNTNYKVLKILNPWLRDNKLTVSAGNSYQIAIPKKGAGLGRE